METNKEKIEAILTKYAKKNNYMATLTHKEKVNYILEKHPNTKFNRREFFLAYIDEYFVGYDAPYYMRDQVGRFFDEFATIERVLRDSLRGNLPKEADIKRYEKANAFKQWKKKMPAEERKNFNLAFNDK